MSFIFDILSNFFYYLVPFILAMGILVFVHELGHYLVAKYYGVKIESFSIGMGKEIWGKTDKSGTRWKISIFPIGGYVMMLGDKDPSSAPNADDLQKMQDSEKEMTLQGKTPWQRILISFAGPFANFLYAFVAILFVYLSFGKISNSSVIDNVLPGTPAAIVGILPGDSIMALNGKPVDNAENAVAEIKQSDLNMNIEISRGGTAFDFTLQLDEKKKMLGVTFKREYQNIGICSSVYQSFMDTCRYISGVFFGVVKMLTGQISMKEFGGPVSIAGMFGDISKTGDFAYFIFFTAILSINLAVINLLPFPALDGGNIFVDFIEILINRALPLKLKEMWSRVGICLLISLIIFATFSDLLKLTFVKKLLSLFGC